MRQTSAAPAQSRCAPARSGPGQSPDNGPAPAGKGPEPRSGCRGPAAPLPQHRRHDAVPGFASESELSHAELRSSPRFRCPRSRHPTGAPRDEARRRATRSRSQPGPQDPRSAEPRRDRANEEGSIGYSLSESRAAGPSCARRASAVWQIGRYGSPADKHPASTSGAPTTRVRPPACRRSASRRRRSPATPRTGHAERPRESARRQTRRSELRDRVPRPQRPA